MAAIVDDHTSIDPEIDFARLARTELNRRAPKEYNSSQRPEDTELVTIHRVTETASRQELTLSAACAPEGMEGI